MFPKHGKVQFKDIQLYMQMNTKTVESNQLQSRAAILRDLNTLGNELTGISLTSNKTNPMSHKWDEITPCTAIDRERAG